MAPERKDTWIRAFYAMSQVWTWLEPTVDRIRLWDAALEDLAVDQLEFGVAYLIANRSGPGQPTPGEIRDAVLGPLTKCAVQRIDGRVTRWEQKRVRPAEQQHVPLSLFRQPCPLLNQVPSRS